LIAEGPGAGELETAAGRAGLVDGAGQDEKREPAPLGEGGAVPGGEPAGLTAWLRACGYGDVSSCWHGLAILFRGLVSETVCGGFAVDVSLNTSVLRWAVIFGKTASRGRGLSGLVDVQVDTRERRGMSACSATDGREWSDFSPTFSSKFGQKEGVFGTKWREKAGIREQGIGNRPGAHRGEGHGGAAGSGFVLSRPLIGRRGDPR
jgi:hypothetical protein